MILQNLNPSEWNKSLIGESTPQQVADRINAGKSIPWARTILDHTKPGDYILELGSGTGELSAILAMNHRYVTLMDFSKESLEFSMELFKILELQANFSEHNVLKPFKIVGNCFNHVFSSGLLEHFNKDDQLFIMQESFRVIGNSVITLVPNAKSIPYRLGKWLQEMTGRWRWGKEDPMFTIGHLYKEIGIKNFKEYSIEPYHALNFINISEVNTFGNLINEFYKYIERNDPLELQNLNQGYLLVSVGYKDQN